MDIQNIDNVKKGVQAAIIALYIMTAKEIDRALIQEDIFVKVMKLITFLINNFAPCRDEEKRMEYKHLFNDNKYNNEDIKNSKKKKRGRKTKKKKQINDMQSQYWSNLYNHLNPMYSDFCSLLLLMNLYNERELVREGQIAQILKFCFESFDIENIDDIQVQSLFHFISFANS